MSATRRLEEWHQEANELISWINNVYFYSIKIVLYNGEQQQWELRLNNAATGKADLVATGYTLDDVHQDALSLLRDRD